MHLGAITLSVWLCTCANFLNQADRTMLSFSIVQIAAEYSIPHVERGWILSAFTFGYITTQMLAGVVVVRCGDAMKVLCGAVLAWSICTLLTPLAIWIVGMYGVYAPVVMCRALMGAAEGFCWPCTLHILNTATEPSARALATTILIAGGTTGQLAAILLSSTAWATQFFALGAAGLVWAVLTYMFFVLANDTTTATPAPIPLSSFVRAYKLYVSHPGLIAVYVAHFCHHCVYYLFFLWMPTYMHEVHGLPEKSLTVLALPLLIAASMGPIHGTICDRLVHRWRVLSLRSARVLMTVTTLIGPGIAALCLVFTTNSNTALFLLCATFFCTASHGAGYMANNADITPTGTALSYGVSNTFATIPGLLIGPLGAAAIANGRWDLMFCVPAVIGVSGAIYYVRNVSVVEDSSLMCVGSPAVAGGLMVAKSRSPPTTMTEVSKDDATALSLANGGAALSALCSVNHVTVSIVEDE